MPHLTLSYSARLDELLDIPALVELLMQRLLDARAGGVAVFPASGIRAFAYPSAADAVGHPEGERLKERSFLYINLRIAPGRDPALVQTIGRSLAEAVNASVAELLSTHRVGIGVQVDEVAPAFDARLGNL